MAPRSAEVTRSTLLDDGALAEDVAVVGDGAMAEGEALVDANGGTPAGRSEPATNAGGAEAHCTSVTTATIVPIGMATHRMKDVNWG